VTDLFLLIPAPFESSARLLWPDPDPDPGRSDPVLLEADMDFWEGDEVLDLADPWMLVTASAWHAIADAGLTGLHAAPLPSLRYSETGAVRARLGELFARELPPFCIARPERAVRIANQDGEENTWSRGDELRYSDWPGDDFTQSRLGPVVSERARSLLRTRLIPGSQLLLVGPR
jgi:hypothetical protein